MEKYHSFYSARLCSSANLIVQDTTQTRCSINTNIQQKYHQSQHSIEIRCKVLAGMWQALLTGCECLRGTLERRKEREEGRRYHWSLVLEAASCQGRNSASETTPSHSSSQMLMNSLIVFYKKNLNS